MQLWTQRLLLLALMPFSMGVSTTPAHAADLPPRPTVARVLPAGTTCKANGVETKCFTLPEWQELGHLILDYRALLDWAASAETLYASEQARAGTNGAEAAVSKASTEAALAREAAALDQARQAQAKADEEHARAKRMGIFAAILGGAVIVLGGVVAGVASAH